ncbi:MAG: tRNA pseudouridine(55) synthase TruB [Candidatus Omnitrophica bacterium]|nr:tRNA pseudouridine(55) synthase TruB [Candidatus Omnitrophota bacterium]
MSARPSLPLNGLLLVDKPAGMTSHDVVDHVRRRFGMRRIGHGGTLDPAATGLLILLVGGATRHARFLLNADKTYHATLRLGETTDTQDGEGKILETREIPPLTPQQIEEVCRRFRGEIEQEIPAYSAVRIQGKRFYDLARAGKSVPRRMRKVRIHSLKIVEICLPEIDLEITCSSGTYIRTLCADLGAALGCGGHLSRLSRTKVGPFTLSQAVTLNSAASEHLVPAERLIG